MLWITIYVKILHFKDNIRMDISGMSLKMNVGHIQMVQSSSCFMQHSCHFVMPLNNRLIFKLINRTQRLKTLCHHNKTALGISPNKIRVRCSFIDLACIYMLNGLVNCKWTTLKKTSYVPTSWNYAMILLNVDIIHGKQAAPKMSMFTVRRCTIMIELSRT